VGDECAGNGAGDCRFEILASLRQRPSHAKVRSTTHLRGKIRTVCGLAESMSFLDWLKSLSFFFGPALRNFARRELYRFCVKAIQTRTAN